MTEAVFDRERRALTVGILLAVGAFAVEGMGVVPALPTAVRELGGMSLFGWAFSAFMLAWIVGTIGGGLIADARGPRLPMALGLIGFAIGLLVAGSARDMAQFLAGRALQGAGGGAMISAAYVAIARGYPDALRARMMALTASVWILPAVLGPAASGAIAQWVGWRWVFAGIIPVLVLTAIMVLPPLRPFDVHREAPGVSRLYASLRVAIGVALMLAAESAYRWAAIVSRADGAALVNATSAANEHGASVARVSGAIDTGASVVAGPSAWGLAAACACVVVGAWLAVPALRALLPSGTWVARRGLPAGLALRGLLAFSFFGTEAFVPLGAGELRGATPSQAGLALTAGALGWISASWAQDRIEARSGAAGRSARMQVGFALLALGIIGVAAALLTELPVWCVPIGWVVAGAGIGLAYSAGGLICIAAAPRGQVGEVSGQLQLAEALSTAAGAGLGGALLTALVRVGQTARAAHAAVFAVTLAAALLGVLIARRARTAAQID